jgi:hypothetical protein
MQGLYHGDVEQMIIPSLQGIDLQKTWRTDAATTSTRSSGTP